ncbi:hypothetical protein Cgig2_006983 [Carnegiea gigantea]|uniref:Uncharacterized protein n=1 Tax=Carnegiea gigantea TaxID=171969 RepID=A0A9Q1KCU3_9CARY|nr:hypothetical protein Cgig2_006983 [Carnegiea gigantea]
MMSDVPLDYAVFQLSPKRSRCELFVSYDGTMERLASGLVKPFVANLKAAEQQVASAAKFIKLDAEGYKDAKTWFTKGTLERFVHFVSTPEVLEMVNKFDSEMSQLESARRIYSQKFNALTWKTLSFQGAKDNQSTVAGYIALNLEYSSRHIIDRSDSRRKVIRTEDCGLQSLDSRFSMIRYIESATSGLFVWWMNKVAAKKQETKLAGFSRRLTMFCTLLAKNDILHRDVHTGESTGDPGVAVATPRCYLLGGSPTEVRYYTYKEKCIAVQLMGSGSGIGSSGDGTGAIAASDATKNELLRAIDVRLEAVKQDLTTACNCAFHAGFCPETVPELQRFADHFGAHRLSKKETPNFKIFSICLVGGKIGCSEACNKFTCLLQRRPELFTTTVAAAAKPRWHSSSDNLLRLSAGSDMSLDDLSDDPSKRSTCHPPTATIDKDKDKPITTTTCTTESSRETPQLTRRLSVQERISLFENKQKENSPSSVCSSTPPAGGKPELRRPDANSSDNSIRRRWSGASDMSIDVSGERKEIDTNPNTPTPTSSSNIPVFAHKSKDQGSLKAEEDSKLPVRQKFGAQLVVSSAGGGGGGSGLEEPALSDSGAKIPSFPGRSSENVQLKDQQQPGGGRVRSRVASFGGGEEFGYENQPTPSQTQLKSQVRKTEQSASTERTASEENVQGPLSGGSKPQEVAGKNLGSLATRFGSRLEGQSGESENEGLRSQFGASQRRAVEVSSESGVDNDNLRHLSQNKQDEADPMPAQPRCRSLGVEGENFGTKDSESVEKQSESFSMQIEHSGTVKQKFQVYGPVSQQGKKVRGRREDGGSGFGGSQPSFQQKSACEDQEPFSSTSLGPVDQAQRAKQAKGNQGLNDELKMKANELEKLFAEHKLRHPGDQSNSARRTRPAERPKGKEGSSVTRKPAVQASPAQLAVMNMESEPTANSSSMEKFNSTPLMKTVDNQDYDATQMHSIYGLGFSDDSRGKLYQKYMQKRDAKLREDWSSKRAEKEAKLKAMQDTLEKSRAEMEAKLSESADKGSSAYGAHNRGEKLRSFNVRSPMKREQPVDLFMNDEDEDQAEFLEKKLNETFLSDSSFRSAQSKRVVPNKSTASPTPRNSSIPIPRSSRKASYSAAGRRRLNSDNPLTQSVPNFSDLRKENTKPSSVASKPSRPQGRNHAHSNSEDLPLPNTEKPRRTQSIRKSTANPMQLNDSRNSDDVDDTAFMSSKYDIEENDHYDKSSMDMESISFPGKSTGVEHFTGLGIDRSKASVVVEAMRNGQDFQVTNFGVEEMMEVAKEEEDVFRAYDMDNGEGRLSQPSDKSATSGYEDNDAFKFSRAGLTSVTELPSSMPSNFRTMGSIHDSLAESHGSWNSSIHNPFSFSHEIPDIDASDSPIGSPASWNFYALGPADAEAARMRKKWGAAQKPIVGADSSYSLSRKDVTKGLKRFLQFGRKNRASESLADWISAATSEGDDDMEDGRDPAYRSEDLRKSRMGFSDSHHSDDGFNESDILNEQGNSVLTRLGCLVRSQQLQSHSSLFQISGARGATQNPDEEFAAENAIPELQQTMWKDS